MSSAAAKSQPKQKKAFVPSIAVGLKKGHFVTKRTPVARTAAKKGKLGKHTKFVRELVREVTGFAPYERRIMELVRNGLEKRAVKLAKRKLGTLRRAKSKYNEMNDAMRKLREQRQREAEAAKQH
eukprot:TRINITY_DN2804_c0_g2_i1.p2 TRINITY_DN2804_c0_g2~~TRINITY_DN2804_c0_g2_i1.p2  ORF type:complete len:125 (-),score=40.26 TRINITY_DN2804_c0_g2_i1:74-448(-)